MIGSGVAGLTAALRLLDAEPGARVGVVAKADLSASATAWAQGGVAAVLDPDEVTSIDARGVADSPELHVADTLGAGAGLCDRSSVEVLTSGGPGCVRHLVELGAAFDRDPAGVLELAREGGHSVARVVHAGGAATGAEVQRCLVEGVRAGRAELWEGTFATELLVEAGRCRGVRALGPDGAIELRATHTLLATGGAGQLFAVTTNPDTSTADGLAMALRAGVAVADVEFVQFHPTALHHPVTPRPLLSEALRGEGALLLGPDLKRFVDELAPRDVVSRAMTEQMLAAGVSHVWLDARGVPEVAERFSTLVAAVRRAGFDATRDLLPVAPAAHYLCGGVLTDLDGATALPGLWAAGEVACTGVHGANRLASNSLLEGLVYATRAVAAIVAGTDGPRPTGALGPLLDGRVPDGSITVECLPGRRPPAAPGGAADPIAARGVLQRAMTTGAGVVRSATSLAETRRDLDALGWPAVGRGASALHHEVANLLTAAHALLDGAEARLETRGCHSRSEHTVADDAWRRRLVHQGPRP